MSWQKEYIDRLYRHRRNWIDGTTQFHRLCAMAIAPAASILEVGAGPTNPTSTYLATLGGLHGLDVDAAVRSNRSLRSASVLDSPRYPFADHCFDACVSNYVVEHLARPGGHLAEVRRVLKPGGVYVLRTVNRHHYVAIVARCTPHRFHELLANRLRRLPREAHEPYPTYYGLNDERAIREEARKAGFSVQHLEMVEKEPSYGAASPLLFLPLVAYELLVNSTEWLAFLRANIFCVLRAQA